MPQLTLPILDFGRLRGLFERSVRERTQQATQVPEALVGERLHQSGVHLNDLR